MLKLALAIAIAGGWIMAYREFVGRGVSARARGRVLSVSGSLFDGILYAVLAVPVLLVAATLGFIHSVLTAALLVVRACLKAWTEQVMLQKYHDPEK
jgi:hypothetical protein